MHTACDKIRYIPIKEACTLLYKYERKIRCKQFKSVRL